MIIKNTKKTTGGKVKSALKKVATGALGAIATAKLGDNYDPKIKREAILDRIDKKLEEKKMGKKYLDTKKGSLEQSILDLWQEGYKKTEAVSPAQQICNCNL